MITRQLTTDEFQALARRVRLAGGKVLARRHDPRDLKDMKNQKGAQTCGCVAQRLLLLNTEGGPMIVCADCDAAGLWPVMSA